ncbi:MAG: transporter [Microbacterium sp.]|jgi:MFS family permease|uniref:MFS transporter n=1 Tax=Microbacterium sp. TaxID=51671 RepID=UPI002616A467|nr:MFS transporter [Microbacterium sp.]MDF2560498.1 transporter [Microbacterium sp.]
MRIAPAAYLASYFLSLLGNSVAAVALPLIVLQATGSVLGAGILAASTAVPAVAAGLFMGVVIDRINRRTSSVVTDLVSAASLAALPIVDLVTGLDIGWFILFGVIGSLGDVPGLTAREALLPAVVRYSGVSSERLVGIREALGALALIVGPAAAGTLMALFAGSTVLWLTAAASGAAALLTLLIPGRIGTISPPADEAVQASGWRMLRDGWRMLLRTPFLLVTTGLGLISVLVLAPLQGLILPVYVTLVGRPEMLGFVLSALAIGMLLGGSVFAVLGRHGDRRVWLVVGLVGNAIGFVVVGALASIEAILVGAVVIGLCGGAFGSLIGVLMIERIPDDMRGRIMGTQNALTTAAPAAGFVAAALLTEHLGVEIAALIIISPWLVALVWGLATPHLRNLERRPDAERAEVVVGAEQ